MTQPLAVEQGRYFHVIGKPPGRELGKQCLAVGDDLERCAGARDHFDLGAIAFYQQVPRTERTRLVVSRNAVFDPDLRPFSHGKPPVARGSFNLILRAAANRAGQTGRGAEPKEVTTANVLLHLFFFL